LLVGTAAGCLPEWASASVLFALSALNGASRALPRDLGDMPLEQREELAAACWEVVIGQFPTPPAWLP
jgi:hypothetical protein